MYLTGFADEAAESAANYLEYGRWLMALLNETGYAWEPFA